jgi:hypothetical protein
VPPISGASCSRAIRSRCACRRQLLDGGATLLGERAAQAILTEQKR